jgi:hypothetical protein
MRIATAYAGKMNDLFAIAKRLHQYGLSAPVRIAVHWFDARHNPGPAFFTCRPQRVESGHWNCQNIDVQSATKNQLSLRLLVCQALGTVGGLLLASLIGFLLEAPMQPMMGSYVGDALVIALVAFTLGIPFFGVAAMILFAFPKSVLEHPILWGVVFPGCLLAVALIAFPPLEYRGIFWIALIPLCALVAGLVFAYWQAKSPLVCDR